MSPHGDRLVVALDGPGGSGKSTVARALARELGLEVLDTGAMYRGVTHAVLRAGVDPADGPAVEALAAACRVEVGARVVVDGEDATDAIRGPEVTAAVSAVSAHPGVRHMAVALQRSWIDEHGGGVLEGRDIGTVVAPDAQVKVFLTASEEERARRRHGDERAAARDVDLAAVQAEIERRDRLDSTRQTSPLTAAGDAVHVDTTGRTVDEVVAEILSMVTRVRRGS